MTIIADATTSSQVVGVIHNRRPVPEELKELYTPPTRLCPVCALPSPAEQVANLLLWFPELAGYARRMRKIAIGPHGHPRPHMEGWLVAPRLGLLGTTHAAATHRVIEVATEVLNLHIQADLKSKGTLRLTERTAAGLQRWPNNDPALVMPVQLGRDLCGFTAGALPAMLEDTRSNHEWALPVAYGLCALMQAPARLSADEHLGMTFAGDLVLANGSRNSLDRYLSVICFHDRRDLQFYAENCDGGDCGIPTAWR